MAGTDTDVGKTVVSALLCRWLQRRGEVRYLKPVQTGTDSDTDTVCALAGLEEHQAPPPPVWLSLPASVDQAAEAEGVDVAARDLLEPVRAWIDQQPEPAWVLECAGGLLVPLNERETQLDVLRALGLPLVLVARTALGTLNHTLLSVSEARRAGLRIAAVFLVGDAHLANEKTLRARLDCPLYHLPRLEPLDAPALDAWLDRSELALPGVVA